MIFWYWRKIHRGGEGSPPMNAPFLTDEERERYRGSYLL